MRVRVLMENSGPDHLVSEHGLSLLVEREESCCLLDAGTTGRFADNARTLGVDLDRVDAAALSHGHYDHTNGFWAFFRENDHAPVVARSAATQPHYSRGRYIGADPALWEEYGHRFRFRDTPTEIAPGLWAVPDDLDHELSLVAETDGGLVVMNSCCHAGVCAIVSQVKKRFDAPVRAVVGGFHLMGPGGTATLGKSPKEVEEVGRTLVEELGVAQVYTGHCTGTPALDLLTRTRPLHIRPLHTGDVLEF